MKHTKNKVHDLTGLSKAEQTAELQRAGYPAEILQVIGAGR